MVPHSTILMCYWFSFDLITAYWGIVDYHDASFLHINVLWILIYGTTFQHIDVLLIFMWPQSSILICYWFSWYLIPAYWCVIDSRVTLFQHTEVLFILIVPNSTILMCYLFSFDLITAYWGIVDYHDTLFHHINVLWILIYGITFQHIDVLLIFMWPQCRIQICYWFSGDLIPASWCVIDSRVTLF
jgi:hypothetical protein